MVFKVEYKIIFFFAAMYGWAINYVFSGNTKLSKILEEWTSGRLEDRNIVWKEQGLLLLNPCFSICWLCGFDGRDLIHI